MPTYNPYEKGNNTENPAYNNYNGGFNGEPPPYSTRPMPTYGEPSVPQNTNVLSLDQLQSMIADLSNPDTLRRLYGMGTESLGRQKGAAGGVAANRASVLAADRGLIGRNQFIQNSATAAEAPYVSAEQNLQVEQAKALLAQKSREFELNYLLNRAMEGDKKYQDELMLKLNESQGSFWDMLPGIAQLIAAL